MKIEYQDKDFGKQVIIETNCGANSQDSFYESTDIRGKSKFTTRRGYVRCLADLFDTIGRDYILS